MKFLFASFRAAIPLAAVAILFSAAGCGNTMYGLGLDMERMGRSLQKSYDPNAASQYPTAQEYLPSQTPPAQNYPPQSYYP